jgi:hypothetical protein
MSLLLRIMGVSRVVIGVSPNNLFRRDAPAAAGSRRTGIRLSECAPPTFRKSTIGG